MKYIRFLVLFAILIPFLAGCGGSVSNDMQTTTEPYVPPHSEEASITTATDVTSLTTTEATDYTISENAEQGAATSYLDNDYTLGLPYSSKYTFGYADNISGYKNIALSTKHTGFFTATDATGKTVLLTPSLQTVVYPKSADYDVLEPFIVNDTVYFRVQSLQTKWEEPPAGIEYWYGIGEYAVVLSDGTFILPFGKYDYIDRYVDGKARAYSKEAKEFYIINYKGDVLRSYSMADKVEPYKLFPDGFIYTRSDLYGHDTPIGHAHAVLDWEGNIIIPYDAYSEHYVPVYMGGGVFTVQNDTHKMYAYGFQGQTLPDVSKNEVIAATEGKIITGTVVNGLIGPLANWEYTVTDYSGKTLIARGEYSFSSGWTNGYALAQAGDMYVILDNDCNEVEIPEGVEITGRYSTDVDLFTARVTKDFRLWRYADVPFRYENPIGVLDGNMNWVIPPCEIESLRGVPLTDYEMFCEFEVSQEGEADRLLRITQKTQN